MSMIRSKNNITSCYTVGYQVTKDMRTDDNTDSLDAAYAPNNVAIAGGQIASYWHDWGNDIFDGWGFYYIFSTSTNKYYFPQLLPINLKNGTFVTQNFNAFNRIFKITHGYPVEGIYKFDISCNDPSFQFIFGAYGDMGSDDDTENTNQTYSYSLDGNNYTLYYNRNIESGDSIERFFSYFVPYETSLNNTKTYSDFLNNDDELSLYSVPVRKGITVYFSKKNDVNQWVVNDLYIFKNRTPYEAFALSLQNCQLYDAYRFYQSQAMIHGLPRLSYDYYRSKYIA